MQNGTDTLDDSLAVSYKTKHILTIQSINHTLWYLCKGVENLCPHKNLHRDVTLFITLFITAKTWKQPWCPSVGECINYGTFKQWNTIEC